MGSLIVSFSEENIFGLEIFRDSKRYYKGLSINCMSQIRRTGLEAESFYIFSCKVFQDRKQVLSVEYAKIYKRFEQA